MLGYGVMPKAATAGLLPEEAARSKSRSSRPANKFLKRSEKTCERQGTPNRKIQLWNVPVDGRVEVLIFLT